MTSRWALWGMWGLATLPGLLAGAACGSTQAPLQLNLAVSPDQLDEVTALARIEVVLTGPTGPGARFTLRGADRVFTPPAFPFQTPLDVAVSGVDGMDRVLYAASARGLTLTQQGALAVTLFFRRGGDFAQTLGPPSATRREHTATLLADGRVLIVGGVDGAGQALATAELYSPALGRFEPVQATLVEARAQHAAVLLGDGSVLLGGGRAGGVSLASIERFSPATGRFERVGRLSIERRELAVARYGVGVGEKTLWSGGRNEVALHATADVFVSQSLSLAAPKTMLGARAGHALAQVPGGFLAIGGNDSRTGEIWRVAEERFVESAATMEAPRARAVALTTADGLVYLAGTTDSLEVFNPSTGELAVRERLPQALSGVQLAQAGAAVLVVGGASAGVATRTGLLFGGVRLVPTVRPLDVARDAPTATTLADGTTLLVGGSAERVAEVFAP